MISSRGLKVVISSAVSLAASFARASGKPKMSLSQPTKLMLLASLITACEKTEGGSCDRALRRALIEAQIFFVHAIKQNISVKIIAPDGSEAWMSDNRSGVTNEAPSPPVGFRKKATDGTLSWGWMQTLTYSPRLLGKNDYKFILWDDLAKQELDQKSVSLTYTKGRCGDPNIERSEPVEFTLPSSPNNPIDTSKEYLPLDDGSVIALDPTTGIGNLVGGSKAWTNIEIVRLIDVKATVLDSSHVTALPEMLEERAVVDKTQIGQFVEFGIDRGPLPQNSDNFPNYRWKSSEIKQLEITDTMSRVIYGKPKS